MLELMLVALLEVVLGVGVRVDADGFCLGADVGVLL